MFHSIRDYPSNGTDKEFAASFDLGYLAQADVHVFWYTPPVGNELPVLTEIPNTDYVWLDAVTIELDVAQPAGRVVRLQRLTPSTELLVDYTNGSVVSESNLDTSQLQSIMIAQEAQDASDIALDVAGGVISDASTALAQSAAAQAAAASAVTTANAAAAQAAAADAKAEEALAAVEAAGVASFNGRSGIVVPVDGDYTASMIPTAEGGVDVQEFIERLKNNVSLAEGANRVHRADRHFDNISSLFGVTGRYAGDTVSTESYLSGWGATTLGAKGGGRYIWHPNVAKSQHNGVTIISPTVPNGGSVGSLSGFYAKTGESDPGGSGVWKLEHSRIEVLQAGALPVVGIDNWNALNQSVVLANSTKNPVFVDTGEFEYSATLDLGYPTLVFRGNGLRNTVLKFTGTGRAVDANSTRPNNGLYSFGLDLSDFTIHGNGNVTDLLRVQINHCCVRNVNVREANASTGRGFRIEGVVVGTFDNIICSTNQQLMTFRPFRCMELGVDVTLPGARASACTFINVIMEGALENGIHIAAADQHTFIGGTSENNPGIGMFIAAGCRLNTVIGMGFENTGFSDVYDEGRMNRFTNCYGTKGFYASANARHGILDGGDWETILIDPGAQHYRVNRVTYNGGGTGALTSVGILNHVQDAFNQNAGVYTHNKKTIQVPAVPASGGRVTNNFGVPGIMYWFGGTVSAAQLARDGGGAIVNMAAADNTYLQPGDEIIITYSAAPTFVFFPLN